MLTRLGLTFSVAAPEDLGAIRELLDQCGLPSSDLSPAHLADFLTCRRAGRLVGTVGWERAGQIALLRSLAVSSDHRGQGIARDLWTRVCDRARSVGIVRFYLLTTTAAALFERWGFARVPREDVPSPIRTTPELTTLCPSSAVVMSAPVL